MIRYCAVTVAQGESPRAINGIDLPENTAIALAKAGGALVRTVYLAIADNENDTLTTEPVEAAGRASTTEPTAEPQIAAVLGYHRPHTAQQKLTAIGGSQQLWKGLITFAQQQSLQEPDITVIKYDLDHNGTELTTNSDAHYRQTTEFTCGPVAVLTAMYRLGIASKPTRDEELQLWREATIAVACEPYGLALAAERRGAHPTIRVSNAGPVLHPDSRLGILDAAMARDTQQAFERQVRERGIDVEIEPFDANDIAALVDAGHMVVVLIDELHMHGEACPHWITVTGRDQSSGALLIDDPWTDADFGETSVDACQMPVLPKDLDLMIRYDTPRSAQAMLIF